MLKTSYLFPLHLMPKLSLNFFLRNPVNASHLQRGYGRLFNDYQTKGYREEHFPEFDYLGIFA